MDLTPEQLQQIQHALAQQSNGRQTHHIKTSKSSNTSQHAFERGLAASSTAKATANAAGTNAFYNVPVATSVAEERPPIIVQVTQQQPPQPTQPTQQNLPVTVEDIRSAAAVHPRARVEPLSVTDMLWAVVDFSWYMRRREACILQTGLDEAVKQETLLEDALHEHRMKMGFLRDASEDMQRAFIERNIEPLLDKFGDEEDEVFNRAVADMQRSSRFLLDSRELINMLRVEEGHERAMRSIELKLHPVRVVRVELEQRFDATVTLPVYTTSLELMARGLSSSTMVATDTNRIPGVLSRIQRSTETSAMNNLDNVLAVAGGNVSSGQITDAENRFAAIMHSALATRTAAKKNTATTAAVAAAKADAAATAAVAEALRDPPQYLPLPAVVVPPPTTAVAINNSNALTRGSLMAMTGRSDPKNNLFAKRIENGDVDDE